MLLVLLGREVTRAVCAPEAPVAGVSGGGRGSKARSAGLQPFNPQRLHAAVLKIAPQFKVRRGHQEHVDTLPPPKCLQLPSHRPTRVTVASCTQ